MAYFRSALVVTMLLSAVCATAFGLEMKTFQKDDYGISMMYPETWKTSDVGTGVWFSPKEQKTATPALILIVSPLTNDIANLEVLLERVMADLKSKYSPEGFGAPQDTLLGGQPAKEIPYTSPFGISNMWIVTIKDGKMYQAWFQGRTSKYNTLLPVVREMLRSYTFIQPNTQ